MAGNGVFRVRFRQPLPKSRGEGAAFILSNAKGLAMELFRVRFRQPLLKSLGEGAAFILSNAKGLATGPFRERFRQPYRKVRGTGWQWSPFRVCFRQPLPKSQGDGAAFFLSNAKRLAMELFHVHFRLTQPKSWGGRRRFVFKAR